MTQGRYSRDQYFPSAGGQAGGPPGDCQEHCQRLGGSGHATEHRPVHFHDRPGLLTVGGAVWGKALIILKLGDTVTAKIEKIDSRTNSVIEEVP